MKLKTNRVFELLTLCTNDNFEFVIELKEEKKNRNEEDWME